MATACIAHSALKVHGISKPIIAKFDQPHASSDGGAILLKAIEQSAVAACLAVRAEDHVLAPKE